MYDEGDQVFHLQGSIGDFEKNSLPTSLDFTRTSNDQLVQTLHSALALEKSVLLKTEDNSLPKAWSDAAKARGWKDACTEAIIMPLQSNRYQRVRGLLVLGLATRISYDAAHTHWIEEIRRSIGDSLNLIRRKEVAAKEIAKREKEVTYMSLQYRRLVKVMELSDVGIFECDCDGNLLQANESWHRLSSFPRQPTPTPAFDWLEAVYEEDKPLVMSNWHSMIQGNAVTVCNNLIDAERSCPYTDSVHVVPNEMEES